MSTIEIENKRYDIIATISDDGNVTLAIPLPIELKSVSEIEDLRNDLDRIITVIELEKSE